MYNLDKVTVLLARIVKIKLLQILLNQQPNLDCLLHLPCYSQIDLLSTTDKKLERLIYSSFTTHTTIHPKYQFLKQDTSNKDLFINGKNKFILL